VDGDAWRGRDASGRNRGQRGLGTQRVAGQVADAGGERRHGEKTEGGEREIEVRAIS